MKKLMILSLLAASALHGFADVSFEVKNVTARQRYPWNGKVDIDFLLESSDPNAEFKVTVQCRDNVGKTNLAVRTLSYARETTMTTEFTLKGGQHWLVWNADADCPNVRLSNIAFDIFANLTGTQDSATYMVIDISGGSSASSWPVTYLTGVPAGGWTDEYKKTKIVLRRCPAGADPLGRYTLTQDFFAGVFEVTVAQWNRVMSLDSDGSIRPATDHRYTAIRGSDIGTRWPNSSEVDENSFIGRLRTKTLHRALDLPTEAQWEYACRAGTKTSYNLGNSVQALAAAGWYGDNSGGTGVHDVGGKLPNAWGLYDMHGNAVELCLDVFSSEALSGTDPKGGEWVSGAYRSIRGGCSGGYYGYYTRCTSSYRDSVSQSSEVGDQGFRLFMTVK